MHISWSLSASDFIYPPLHLRGAYSGPFSGSLQQLELPSHTYLFQSLLQSFELRLLSILNSTWFELGNISLKNVFFL